MTKQEVLSAMGREEREAFLARELVISIEDRKGCFKLMGDLLLNTVAIAEKDPERFKKKVKLSRDFIKNSRAVQMWADCFGVDSDVIKKKLLENLDRQEAVMLQRFPRYVML